MVRNVILFVVFSVFFAGFFTATEARSFAAASEKPKVISYMMKKGDSLWKLSKKYYGSGRKYATIKKFNHIKDVRKIRVGKIIYIPQIKKMTARKAIQLKSLDQVSTKPVKVKNIFQAEDGNTEEIKSKDVAEFKENKIEPKITDEDKAVNELTVGETAVQHREVVEAGRDTFTNISAVESSKKEEIVIKDSTSVEKTEVPVIAASKKDTSLNMDDLQMSIKDPEAKNQAKDAQHELMLEVMGSRSNAENMVGGKLEYLALFDAARFAEGLSWGVGTSLQA